MGRMNKGALVRIVCFCSVLHAWTLGAAAQTSDGERAAALEVRLESASGGDRIPLLLELAGLPHLVPDSVLSLAGEVLELLEDHPSRGAEIEVRLVRSGALEILGQYPEALSEAERADDLADGSDHSELSGRAKYRVARVQWRMASYDEALAWVQEARALQEPRGPSEDLQRTLTVLGAVQMETGALDAALESFLVSLDVSEAIGDERSIARSHNNIGLVYWDLGRYEEAYEALARALSVHERVGPPASLSAALSNVGLVLIDLERPDEAVPYLERSLALDLESGDLYGQAKSHSNLGYAYEMLGRVNRAMPYHREALRLREQIGDRDGVLRTRSVLAGIEMERGDMGAALDILEPTVALASEIGSRIIEAELLEMMSNAHAALGDSAAALVAYQRFHEVQSELADAEASRHLAELDVQYQAEQRERDLAAAEALASTRAGQLKWLVSGSALLLGLLVLSGVLLATRARSQRALAESEQRYRTVFHTSGIPTFLIEPETQRIFDLNEPAKGLCTRRDGSHSDTLDCIEPEWARAAVSRIFESHPEGQVELEDSWTDGSGRVRWTHVHATPVQLSGRERWLVGLRDVTAARAEEEARLQEDKMDSLGVLAGGLAHDFNNVLTAVAGHIALARKADSRERLNYLLRAEQAAIGARQLTSQLLAFSKGGEPLRELTDVGPALRQAVELAQSGSHLRVDLSLPDDLWSARLDRGQFSQLVSNLVINAQQATEEGGRLVVRATNFRGRPPLTVASGEGQYVRIQFEDDGPGVATEARDRIFDPYFSTKPGGSGLGLASAYAICRKHGGALVLESGQGRGAAFSAYFPAASEAAPPAEPWSTEEPRGSGSVLVLEDEPLVQDVLQVMMEQWGFRVEVVAHGRAAVDRYTERLRGPDPFRFLVMDLTIPGGMGGRQAMAEILRVDPDALAIVASGYSDDPTMARYEEAGFAAALVKPFKVEELARVVNAVLRPDADSASEEPGAA